MRKGREELGSVDEEIIKNLMDLRSYLQKRIQELEDEVEKIKSLFKIVNEVIVTKSFRKAEVIPQKPITTVAPSAKPWEEIPLKTSLGTLLATMNISKTEVRIVPTIKLVFNVNTPPFQSFLIDRILEPMRTSDIEAFKRGEITKDNILSYRVIKEGDVIKEIKVNNYGLKKRLREITTTSRWTLEKMYEKTHPPK